MPVTDVILLGLPTLMRDIVRDMVSCEPRLRLVAEVSTASQAVEAAARAAAHVAFIAGPDCDDDDIVAILCAYPRARTLTIADHGRALLFNELAPKRTALGEATRERLLQALSHA